MEVDLQNIEQQLNIFCSPQNYDQQSISNAANFVNQLQSSPQGLQWALNTYQSQQNKQIRVCQLGIIKWWCRNCWDKFTQELYEQVRAILFTESFHAQFFFQPNSASFSNVITDTQVSFMWRSFPKIWPNFWADYFSTFQRDFILQFIYAFANYASILEGEDNLIYNQIKDAMRQNGSDNLVASFIIELMGTGDKTAFSIFDSLCKWVNVYYILTNESIVAVQKGLTSPEFSTFSLNIFTRLVQRGMPIDKKIELIMNLNIPQHIASILNQCSDTDIATAAASLINAAGQEVKNYQICGQYAEMALTFLMHPSDDVCVIVVPFLLLLCKVSEDLSRAVLFKSLERLQLFLASFEETNERVETVGFLEQLTLLSHLSLLSFHNNFSSLAEMWGDGSLIATNINKAAAIVHAVQDVLSGGEPKELIPVFMQRFIPIVQLEPPLSPLQSFAVADFVRFFVASGDAFNREQVTFVFREVCRLTTCPSGGLDDGVRSELAGMLLLFLKKMAAKVEFDPQIIFQFISTLNQQFVEISGALIRALPLESQGPVFATCMQRLQTLLEQSDRSDGVFGLVLSFVKSLRYGPNAPHVEHVQLFLTSIRDQMIERNDHIQALFIRTVFSSLGVNGFQLVLSCIDFVNGHQSTTALCDTALALLKNEALQKDWIGMFLQRLIEPILGKFSSVQSWALKRSEENKEILLMTCSFIHLFASAIGNAPQAIAEPRIFTRMLAFVGYGLATHFDMPAFIESLIEFITQLLRIEPKMVFDDYAMKTMYCLYSDKFDPTLKSWFNVCKRIINLHGKMLKVNLEGTVNVILHSLALFGGKEEHVQLYLNVLNLERPRDVKSQGRVFFVEFVKYKAANGT